jgi:hemerythrin-like domain-containing protein
MITLTQPLRDEHKDLFPNIENLKKAGLAVNNPLTSKNLEKIGEAYSFLKEHLLPHARAEEAALYPVVQKVMGSSSATATMSRDHVEIEQLTLALGRLRATLVEGSIDSHQENDLKLLLFGLFTLVKVHFAKEEGVYLPLLDTNLSKEQAQEMFIAMERAAHAAKAEIH